MNCCGNHNHDGNKQNQEENYHHNIHKNHKWMMILCCTLPIILVAVLFLTNNVTQSINSAWLTLLVLLCPISHIILMPLMMRKKKN